MNEECTDRLGIWGEGAKHTAEVLGAWEWERSPPLNTYVTADGLGRAALENEKIKPKADFNHGI